MDRIRKQLRLEPVSVPDEDGLTRKVLAKFGSCPHCGSEEIDAGNYDGDTELTCVVSCDDCGAIWGEKYHFMGAWWQNIPDDEEDDDDAEGA